LNTFIFGLFGLVRSILSIFFKNPVIAFSGASTGGPFISLIEFFCSFIRLSHEKINLSLFIKSSRNRFHEI